MESIKELYIYGPGPSSSHTIGPYKASIDFIKENKNFSLIKVTLFGSLALTGKGHATDIIIKKALKNYNSEVIFNYSLSNLKHPNTLLFEGYNFNNKLISSHYYYSVGGGKILKDTLENKVNNIYPHHYFNDIKNYISLNNLNSLVDYVNKFEDSSIDDYLNDIVNKMYHSIEFGLEKEGKLPGELKINRVAKHIYKKSFSLKNEEKTLMLLTSFAYAVSENNASGENIVTAPTCGSSGIVPSIIYYEEKYNNVPRKKIIDSLKVGAIFGNLAKENASIAGATGGCQAEIGVASSMGAAIFSYIHDLSLYQIEYAAEVALEHFLGLTCDPVKGYVQVPCIERNGIGVLRSYNSFLFAKNIALFRKNIVSYDNVIETMKNTGNDLHSSYKETSEGGLAKIIK